MTIFYKNVALTLHIYTFNYPKMETVPKHERDDKPAPKPLPLLP